MEWMTSREAAFAYILAAFGIAILFHLNGRRLYDDFKRRRQLREVEELAQRFREAQS